MAADLRAARPPARSNTAAITPSLTAQNTRCQIGGSGSPPDVSISTTKDPESEDVMKKIATTSAASSDVVPAAGSRSSKA